MNQAFITDSELLAGLAEGNTAAVEMCYRLYHPVLMKWMLSRGGIEADAEDVFQEALLVLYQKAKSEAFCLTCKLSTYLFAVSKRLWYKKLNQEKQLILKDQADDDSEEALTTAGADADLKAFWEQEAQFSRLETALERLGYPCNALLKAFYEEQKNMQEIASRFRYTNAENAKTQKYKCLNRLRKLFFEESQNGMVAHADDILKIRKNDDL